MQLTKEERVKMIEKSLKQGLAISKDLTVKLHEGRDSTYHRLDYIWMKIYFFRLPDNLTWRQVIKTVIQKMILKIIKITIIWRKK